MNNHGESPGPDRAAGPGFEWRAPLGPWRWLILGTFGVVAGGCGARAERAVPDRNGADLERQGHGGEAGSAMVNGEAGAAALSGQAGAGGSSPIDDPRPTDLSSACVPESSLGGNWVRCTNGMLHRTEVGVCESKLPRADDEMDRQPWRLPDGGVSPSYCFSDTDCPGLYDHCEGGQGGPYCAHGCISDADCGANEICLCGPYIGECRPAQCTTDADCGGSALCGSYEVQPTCYGISFACQTAADECAGDLDCGAGNFCTRQYSYPDGDYEQPLEADHRSCTGEVCIIGRPFLIDGAERLAPKALRGDWYPEQRDARAPLGANPSLRGAIADGWTEQALMEHASVAAFARFTLQLASLGAPAELMAASAAAMQDEVRHARACFALARRHMDHDVGPGPLSIDGALADMDFRSIVLGTLHEGCIGETVAALEAAEAAEHCEDETARVVLRQIAIEEGQHAELAWRFVAWALEVGPANLVDCVREAFEAALAPTEPPSLTALHASDRELVRHGLFTPPLRAALRARVLSTVVAPCAGALLAKVEAERPRAPLAGSSKSAPGRAAVGAATHPAA